MGVLFEAKFANIISYLTDGSDRPAPRLSTQILSEFLEAFGYGGDYSNRIAASERGMSSDRADTSDHDIGGASNTQNENGRQGRSSRYLISSSSWADDLEQAARLQSNKMLSLSEFEVTPEHTLELLAPLRPFFNRYPLYSMVFSNHQDHSSERNVHDLFEEMAIASQGQGLIFKPIHYSSFLDFVDPFPCIRALTDSPVEFPAVVFWTPEGSAVALSLQSARAFFRDTILPILQGGKEISQILSHLFDSISQQQRTKRILHLSDLHFGKPEAAARRRYLKEELETICRDVDRVVVTGDLFDNPTADLRAEFDEFRADVERFTRLPLLLIPGNHDVRTKGNRLTGFSENFKHVTSLWTPVEIDYDLRTVFFCFNSCEGGNFARGQISRQQRLDMAASYKQAIRKHREVESYTKIALVHHHPLPFENEPEPEALYQKLVQRFFKPDKFIEFENAEEFNIWCIKRDVSLILHGHKHFPRQSKLGNKTLVVGCGSTTGVEDTPMCYDIVTLNEDSNQWSVTFYMDEHGDGGGFELQAVTLPSS